jgi:hypothetical protein
LRKNISTNGLQAPEYCAFGPGARHYTRWKNDADSNCAIDQVKGLLLAQLQA